MASSRTSLNTPDWRDAVGALLAIARAVGGVVDVRMGLSGTEGRPKLSLTGRIVAMDPDHGVVRDLASASVAIGSGGGGDIPTALLSLAYELDRDAYRRQTGMLHKPE